MRPQQAEVSTRAPEATALRSIILREFTSRHIHDGALETAIPGVTLFRYSAPTALSPVLLEPRISFALQGTKRIVLNDKEYVYGAAQYFLTAVDVPVVAQIVAATRAKPYLCFLLKLDLSLARQMISECKPAPSTSPLPDHGVCTGPVTPELLDAGYRLVRLLATPGDIPTLSNLIKREIMYRLLTSAQGYHLRQIAFQDSYDQRIARAIALLKQNYAAPLAVAELAHAAGMGISTMYHHFKALTAMSPLQYQKHLRLHAARQLLLNGACDAGSAAFEVGYESRSQFTREYRRLFGEPPMRDIKAIKAPIRAFDRAARNPGSHQRSEN